jgi:NADPH2 dehydrogenase
MGSISAPALFAPTKVGASHLKHRVVFAPCTRFRCDPETHAPIVPLKKMYYEQRASVPGTLIISEGTIVAEKACGMGNAPGIWSNEQISAWKEVSTLTLVASSYLSDRMPIPYQITEAVHAKGSFIYLQLYAMGRAARPEFLHGHPLVSASGLRLSTAAPDIPDPRPLTIPEINEYVELFAAAARNAIAAGFDGVEVHSANGYLLDQFLQDVSNKRTDDYGGSIEKRSRFGLRVVDSVVKAIGANRTGVRFSPWSTFQGRFSGDPPDSAVPDYNPL